MIRKLLPFLFSSLALVGQVIHAGSSDDNYFTPVQGCTLTTSCTFTDSSLIPSTIRYSNTDNLTYNIPEPNGPGVLTLGFNEPTSTKVNQRVFNVSVNGIAIGTIDIYKQAGGNKHYWTMPPINVNVVDNFVHVVLTQVTGKPLIATLDYHGLALQGPKGDPGVVGLTGAPGPLPTFLCSPTTACKFDPATSTFTITLVNTAALPACNKVAANTLGMPWTNEIGNVYISHVIATAPLDCIPGPDKIGTVILDALNNPIGSYFIAPLP